MATSGEFEMIAVRGVMAVLFATLAACAGPRLVNPTRPSADFHADTAACEREAERVGKRELLANPGEFSQDCATCRVTPGGRDMLVTTHARLAQQRCLAVRGWRQAS